MTPANPLQNDSRTLFAFAHDLRSYLRTVVTRIQLVQTFSGSLLPDRDQGMLSEAVTAAIDIDGLLTAMVAYCEVQVEDRGEGSDSVPARLLLQATLLETKTALSAVSGEVEVRNELNPRLPQKLKIVLKELVGNSCRFRKPDEPVRIVIATQYFPPDKSQAMIGITVSDNGLGVDASELAKIFTPFHRLHARGQFPGFGLGLATCRRIMESLGGTILAESLADGLAIHITIPLLPAA